MIKVVTFRKRKIMIKKLLPGSYITKTKSENPTANTKR